MEASDILGALHARPAILPGGRDREGRPLLLVTVPAETDPWRKEDLDLVLRYVTTVFSLETRRSGLAVVIDAHRGAWRLVRTCTRQVELALGTAVGTLIVVRPDVFWDKQRVDCTRSHKEGQPIYIPLSRLYKYFETAQLPEELNGTWPYDHNQWIQNRIYVEAFTKDAEAVVSDLEKVRQRLINYRPGARVSSIEEALTLSKELYESTKDVSKKVLLTGKELIQQFEADYAPGHQRRGILPQDVEDTKEKVKRLLEILQGKQILVEEAWSEMEKSFVNAKEINILEDGVSHVTKWILGSGESLLNSQKEVGYDVTSAEALRQEHEALELQCRETYGQYAELLHKIDILPKANIPVPNDLKSQRDFMDFVCRSFASRLERRRNMLITSLRFFRLVSEYFERTAEVFETLVMCDNIEEIPSAELTLQDLQENQSEIEKIELEAQKEGEKLMDMLSMPVKDALGKEVNVNYESDILNIQEILETTTARKHIFSDSIELQKLRLQQITHIQTYERDASQAIQWLEDLFQVMLKSHSHVGCSIYEIQTQKEEHQAFQETAKGTYEYGCQLLSAAMVLRQSCKLPVEVNSSLSQKMWEAWKQLQTVGQEQMTRLRVSAVFHRSVEEHCNQLKELTDQVKSTGQAEDPSRKRSHFRKVLMNRERLLLEVGRMVRLGRLLRTRLREPLYTDKGSKDENLNATAVEAISEKLSEVTGLAEELDASLCERRESASSASSDIKKILEGTASSTSEEWYTSFGTSKSEEKSDEEFVTASECTCTPSRSSSYHTASEGGSAPWWDVGPPSDTEGDLSEKSAAQDVQDQACEEKETHFEPLHQEEVGKPRARRKPGQTSSTSREVTETTTTHLKISQSHTLGVSSYLLTTETVRDESGSSKSNIPEDSGSKEDKTEVPPQLVETPDSTVSDVEDPLLQQMKESREWLQLKILELHPDLTQLGASLQEALDLQRAHDEVLIQLQSKQSPVEELLRQADQLISTQRPRAEVYAAMAESLGLAWKDVNHQLEQRKNVLDANVSYHSRAQDYVDKMQILEIACKDSSFPQDVDNVKKLLTRLHDLRKSVLEASMVTLQEGQALLDKIQEIAKLGTLDSRPGRIRVAAEYAISQVEHWLEALHDQRRLVELMWQQRKTQVEQWLALLLLSRDLDDVDAHLKNRREMLVKVTQLGESQSSSELLLHEHNKLIAAAKELQDKALKITKATEQLTTSGHSAAEQVKTRAYMILHTCAEYLEQLEQRHTLLTHSISFFRLAHTALTKLDQLEVQLATADLPASSPHLAQLHSQVCRTLEDITSSPLQEGHNLLEMVGYEAAGAKGVKRTVEDIENRKVYLKSLCTASNEENVKLSQALNVFLEKQNDLYSWLVSIAEAFVQGHQDMGSVLAMAKDFLELHHKLLNDLHMKGTEIDALLSTLPPILEFLDQEQRRDVEQKVDNLRSHWMNLKSVLENRIDLSVIYVKFHTLAVQLANELDAVEDEFRKGTDRIHENTIKLMEEKWLSIQQLYLQLTNTARNFHEDASKVQDPYLDIKRARLCVETLVEHFGGRQLVITESWQFWQTKITMEREFKVQWERLMSESTRTIDWVSKLDAQCYPVLLTSSSSSKVIAQELEEQLQKFLSEVKRAQTEIELRVKTTETLSSKGEVQGIKEDITSSLMQQHQKLQSIITEYQILVQMLIAFFKNLAELDKTIETLQSQYRTAILSNEVPAVELLLKEHGASRQAVQELFKFTQNESEQIITRIRQQEPPEAARHDVEKVVSLLRLKQATWEVAWTEQRNRLEQHLQLCQFNDDLHQINLQLNDLSKQLSSIRGQYGESLAEAKATSLAFVYFEKTIELLEQRIQTFVSTAERMLTSEHISSHHIQRELSQLQSRWSSFHMQVTESRRLINLSIEYFTLVEEAEEWFRQGSKLLVTIARKSLAVKTPDEASQLLHEVEYFLKPGEVRQDERIRRISSLAVELYGEERSKQVTIVLMENKEMLESFTVINEELNILARNLKAAEIQRENLKKEKEEADATLAAAKAEAAAARAAAAAAEEARKAAEAAERAMREAIPVKPQTVHKIVETEAIPLPPSKPTDDESQKAPSPPMKKQKLVEDLPQPSPPIFTVPLHDATIQEGEKFTFECRVTGFPMPEVIWYKDGISIQNNPDYQTTFDQGICTLTIEETFTEDSARFTCKAGNAAGIAETRATLSVKETEPHEQLLPPTFTKVLQTAAAKEGDSFQFECTVTGNPLPTIQWFKNDVCIDNSSDYVITYNNGEATLRFEEVFLEDQAEYVCKATNQVGSDQCTAKLSVEPLEPTEAPSFAVPLSNVMARAGQKIKLECEVLGLPAPQVTWLHNSKPFKETRDAKMQFDGKVATLIIPEAFPKDAGVYVVAAKNIAGEATSSCNVSVKGRLPTETSDSELASDMEPIKPSIHLPLKDISVFEGKKVRLDCVIVGQPEPEVIWYHDDRPVKESSDFQLLFQGDRCSLIIQEAYLEDAGRYKVIAINSAGEASSQCSLTVQCLGPSETEKYTTREEIITVTQEVGMAPKFSKLLTDILACEGEKVTFECIVSGDPRPTIKWFLNNQELSSSERIQFIQDPSNAVSLTIPEVSPEDKGVYTVKATNPSGEAKCFANLIVKSVQTPEIKRKISPPEEKLTPPEFKELFGDKCVLAKEPARFECVVTGKPMPTVRWLLNDADVATKQFNVETVGDRHVLTIPESSVEHTGRITCIAENEVGKATCLASLLVKEPAIDTTMSISTFEDMHSEHRVESFTSKRAVFMQSSQVTKMSSSGFEEPHVEKHSLSEQSERMFEKIGDKPAKEIESHKKQELHQVNAETPVVRQQASVTVFKGGEDQAKKALMSPKPQRKSTAPRFIVPLQGKIVDQGSEFVLEGIIDGFPEPSVTWLKNGVELPPKEGLETSFSLNKPRLEIKSVTVKDGGRYTCKAVNPMGTASSTADLVVKKTLFPPVFGRRLQAQVVNKGDRVFMEVEVTGTPTPDIAWFKDGVQLRPESGFRIKSEGNCSTFIIDKASFEHCGKFMVKATNPAGEAQSIADFVVMEPMPDTSIEVQRIVLEDLKEEKKETHEQQQLFKIAKEEASREKEPPKVAEVSTAQPTEPPPKESLPLAPATPEPPRVSSPFRSDSPITKSVVHKEITETTRTEKHITMKMGMESDYFLDRPSTPVASVKAPSPVSEQVEASVMKDEGSEQPSLVVPEAKTPEQLKSPVPEETIEQVLPPENSTSPIPPKVELAEAPSASPLPSEGLPSISTEKHTSLKTELISETTFERIPSPIPAAPSPIPSDKEEIILAKPETLKTYDKKTEESHEFERIPTPTPARTPSPSPGKTTEKHTSVKTEMEHTVETIPVPTTARTPSPIPPSEDEETGFRKTEKHTSIRTETSSEHQVDRIPTPVPRRTPSPIPVHEESVRITKTEKHISVTSETKTEYTVERIPTPVPPQPSPVPKEEDVSYRKLEKHVSFKEDTDEEDTVDRPSTPIIRRPPTPIPSDEEILEEEEEHKVEEKIVEIPILFEEEIPIEEEQEYVTADEETETHIQQEDILGFIEELEKEVFEKKVEVEVETKPLAFGEEETIQLRQDRAHDIRIPEPESFEATEVYEEPIVPVKLKIYTPEIKFPVKEPSPVQEEEIEVVESKQSLEELALNLEEEIIEVVSSEEEIEAPESIPVQQEAVEESLFVKETKEVPKEPEVHVIPIKKEATPPPAPKEPEVHVIPITKEKTPPSAEITERSEIREMQLITESKEPEVHIIPIKKETSTSPEVSRTETTKIEEIKCTEVHTHIHKTVTKLEKVTDHAASLLEEFNLEPGPPPEIGYIPKPGIQIKVREDVADKVKKLEEAQKAMSPIDIPSGAVRIFPPPKLAEPQKEESGGISSIRRIVSQERTESPFTPFPDLEPFPFTPTSAFEPAAMQLPTEESVEVETKVEEKSKSQWSSELNRDISLSFQKDSKDLEAPAPSIIASVEKPLPTDQSSKWPPQQEQVDETIVTEEKRSEVKKLACIWPPVSEEPKVDHRDIVSEDIKKEVVEEVCVRKMVQTEGSDERTIQRVPIARPVTPGTLPPSAEGIAMEKLWTPHKTPEPEFKLHHVPERTESPKPTTQSIQIERSWASTALEEQILKAPEVQLFEPVKPIDSMKRAASPKPSVEGLAMEKLWAARKIEEPEPTLQQPPEPVKRPASPRPMTGVKKDMSTLPSAEGLAMEKLWAARKTPEPEIVHLPTDLHRRAASPIIQAPVDLQRAASPKPSAEGLAMDRIWAHKSHDSAVKKLWPPSAQEIQEEKQKTVLWSSKLNVEKVWPPPQEEVEFKPMIEVEVAPTFDSKKHIFESIEKQTKVEKYTEIISRPIPEPVVEPKMQTEIVSRPVPEPVVEPKMQTEMVSRPVPEPVLEPKKVTFDIVDQGSEADKQTDVEPEFTMSVESRRQIFETMDQRSEVDKQIDIAPEITTSIEMKRQMFEAAAKKSEEEKKAAVQHYIAEARVVHKSNMMETDSQVSSEIITEKSEFQSEKIISKESFEETILSETTARETSPSIIEERTIKPSEAKKLWPPMPEPEFEVQPPPVVKHVEKRDGVKPKPPPPQEIMDEPFAIPLEPGPPPEIGFIQGPVTERRPSKVESIDLDLEKEPKKHLVGAVRTIPPPPKDKAPPRKTSEPKATPQPMPKTVTVTAAAKFETKVEGKKEMKKSITIESKPFKRFPDLEPFPFKPEPAKPQHVTRGPPPPTPSKFVRGKFSESDYESDLETSRILPKWRPWESDTDEPMYRKVRPVLMSEPKRARSTEPPPPPPSSFDQPPEFEGPPRPVILDGIQRETKRAQTICKTKTETRSVSSKFEVKKESVQRQQVTETRRKKSPPLKPGSPPQFVEAPPEPAKSPTKSKPDSPKSKREGKIVKGEFQESGYMADTDEPIRHKQSAVGVEKCVSKETTKPSLSTKQGDSVTHHMRQEKTEIVTSSTKTLTQHKSTAMEKSVHKTRVSRPTPKTHQKPAEPPVEKKATEVVPSKPKEDKVFPKTKKEVITSSPVKQTQRKISPPKKEVKQEPQLEPFPYKPDPPKPKSHKGPPPPTPSKFVKGQFHGSDYESDYEGRIPPVWRPGDSDTDELLYRSVRPILKSGRSSAPVIGRSPTPPTEFDTPPKFEGPLRPKFEPIDKPRIQDTPVSLEEILKPKKQMPVQCVKPKPIIPKTPTRVVPVHLRETEIIPLEPGPPPEEGYAPPPTRKMYEDTTKIPPYQNALQMESSKVMHFTESTQTSHRVVSMEHTTKVIKFGEKEPPRRASSAPRETSKFPALEPFPYQPDPPRPKASKGPPPPTPKKFVRGEFRESDYESDYESARIKPKWVPHDSDTDEPQYRKVKPPSSTPKKSRPSADRVPTPPTEFDTPPSIEGPPRPTLAPLEKERKPRTSFVVKEFDAEQRRMQRVEEMKRRFSDTSVGIQTKQPPVGKAIVPVTNILDGLQPGEPPEYGFAGRVPTTATYVASQHLNEMSQSFKSKAQNFVEEIMTLRNGQAEEKSGTKVEDVKTQQQIQQNKEEEEPHAYREESRVAEYGTKHIDPDTGLIYFKYDFGYEFGIVLPGEGKKGDKKKHVTIESRKDDDIEVPVIIERTKPKIEEPQTDSSSEAKQTPATTTKTEGKVQTLGVHPARHIGKQKVIPQFKPKKFSHFKSVKWEPTSESELSECEADTTRKIPQSSVHQHEPKIIIPVTRWEPTPSPLSLSPSIPSLSPRLSSIGPHSVTPGLESGASPAGSPWLGLSPTRGPRPQGRGSTPTPPSTPSTTGSLPGSTHGSNQLRRPPMFITPLRDIAVISGQTARFECIVQAEPPPNILWSKNGRIIENSADYQIQYKNGVCRLTIPEAYPEDAGTYSCTATNMLGTIGTTGTLQVPGEKRKLIKK